MNDVIKGLWVASATPLASDGTVDHAALTRHARGLLDAGCDGLVLFGTTGEGTSFGATERLRTVEALLRSGIGPDKLCLGVGCPAIVDTVALSKGALGAGLSHVLALPPYFYRDADRQGLEDAFAAIIDQVGDDRLRMTLYHIPQVSGVSIAPETLASLRRRYGRQVAGVKDSTADFASFRRFRAASPESAITVGNESDIHRALAEGGTGTICGMANIVPALVRRMFSDADAAGPMRDAVSLMTPPFLPTLKAVLAAQTGEESWLAVRAPLRPADLAHGQRVLASLQALGRQAAA